MMMKKKHLMWIVPFIAISLVMTGCSGTKQQEQEEQAEKITLPYELDDGKLLVNSVFQSSIANPDCNDETGENIASIELVNQSGQFVDSANITVTLEDNTTLNFEISDIPADGTVWAFEIGNAEIPETPVCESITCDAKYEDEMPVMADQLEIKAEETSVTIRNLTDQDLTNLKADFHCLFDEIVYYGGKTYTYPIDIISAGEEVTLEVDECYLGTAQAVRVTEEE